MTNTTQCPACKTRFKVSDAQLAAAGGRVRCGRCAHVFNALDHVPISTARPVPPAEPERQRDIAPPPAPPRAPAVQQPNTQPPAHDADDFELEVPDFDPHAAALATSPLPDYPEEVNHGDQATGASQEDLAAFQQALNEALQSRSASAPIGNPFDEMETPSHSAPHPEAPISVRDDELPDMADKRRALSSEPESETLAVETEPFVAQQEAVGEPPYDPALGSTRTSKSLNPAVSAILAIASLIGLLLLAGQLIYINRTVIASQAPELRPTLEVLCRHFNCTVPLPTDQQFIRTEWSELSFVPEHNNLIQLSATLKNHAPYPQAFPMMEVTLKDANNQVLVRKVFTPEEYLKPVHKPSSGFAADSQIKIIMRFDVGQLHAQGYSLTWFYP